MEKTFHIQWHITNFCNLRCRHCYQDDFSKMEDLPFFELKNIFKKIEKFLKENDMKLVLDITGGEPFLYEDFLPLIEYISSSTFVKKLGVITNGFFINERYIDIFLKYSIELKISAEGVDRESYEYFRGKGNFEKFKRICEIIKESELQKTLMFTLLDINFPQIEKTFQFIEKYNFNCLVIERFIPWGMGRKIKEYLISGRNWVKTVEILFEKCGIEKDFSLILPYRAFMVKIENMKYNLYGAPCIIGKDGCAIMPDGAVYPCRRLPFKIGDLKNQELSDILKSPVLKKMTDRKFLKGKCGKCEIEDCLGCRALAYSLKGDFLEEDPLCFLDYLIK
ncbi:MAG: hypothetical protein DRP67_01310 [Candidatus Omnitrophota bacterium]|nr:MAG: hypothetical protein DRP67_01310 [Candidatus Omnitrophota bacterium]